jgi:hypothetical protein
MYMHQKKIVSEMIRKSKTDFYTNKVLECGRDQKALFKVINTLQGRDNTAALPSFSSPAVGAEAFSDFFCDKISGIRKKLDSQENMTNAAPLHLKTVLPLEDHKPVKTNHSFESVTEKEIRKIIESSPPKSCCLDPIPTWLLKSHLDVLTPVLTLIVNRSLQEGYFPLSMKKAIVKPLLKKPSLDKEVMKNYRPVSNLSFVSKITEKAAMAQVSKFVSLTKFQSAYRPLHSTETALLRVQNDILMQLDAGKGVLLCLLDLSAAFDTIDHNIFLQRLTSRFGIEGSVLTWYTSYLQDRFQSVSVNGATSIPRHLTFGFPQGSVSGPQGFSKYSDVVPEIADKHDISAHLFADDTQYYLPFSLTKKDSDNASVRMEDCCEDTRRWMTQNKLKLNEDKTEVLVILPYHHSHKSTIDSLSIGGYNVQTSKCVRNLGVLFDSSMLMKDQINSVVKGCNIHLRSIGRIRQYLSFEAASNLVHAFITSRLDYGNSLLSGLPNTSLSKLQKVQNTAARILSKTRKYDHITPILDDLHWLTVQKRIDFKILLLTYKCLNQLAPPYLSELLKIYQPCRPLRSGTKYALKVPRTRLKTYGDRAFACRAPVLWNNLPSHIKSAPSVDSFKRKLKSYLFRK